MPTYVICIFATSLPGVLALGVTALGLYTQLWLYGREYCWHYIWVIWCGGYPTGYKDQWEWTFWIIGFQGAIMLWHNQCVKEWHRSIRPGFLCSELDVQFNWIDGKLIRNSLLWDVVCTTKVSFTYLKHRPGALGAVLSALDSKLSMRRLATMALIGNPIVAPSNFSQYLPWNRK